MQFLVRFKSNSANIFANCNDCSNGPFRMSFAMLFPLEHTETWLYFWSAHCKRQKDKSTQKWCAISIRCVHSILITNSQTKRTFIWRLRLILLPIGRVEVNFISGRVELFSFEVPWLNEECSLSLPFFCNVKLTILSFCFIRRIVIPGVEKALALSEKYSKPGFDYYGEGLDRGQCGVIIRNVKSINHGVVTCQLAVAGEEYVGTVPLIVARKLFEIIIFKNILIILNISPLQVSPINLSSKLSLAVNVVYSKSTNNFKSSVFHVTDVHQLHLLGSWTMNQSTMVWVPLKPLSPLWTIRHCTHQSKPSAIISDRQTIVNRWFAVPRISQWNVHRRLGCSCKFAVSLKMISME